MKQLNQRMRDILERKTALPERRRQQHYSTYKAADYDMSGIEGYDTNVVVGPKKTLTPTMLDTLEGRTDVSPEERLRYCETLVAEGYDLTGVRDLPPLHRMAVNFAVAKYKQLGQRKLTVSETDARLLVCRQATCGSYRVLGGKERCSHASCGCFLTDKVKDSTAKCPKDLW